MPRRSLFLAAIAATATLAIAAVPAREASQAKLDDPTIVAIFDAANTKDIETGQVALERGQSQEVRDFGAMLVRDHQAVRQQGRDLAAKLHVTPTPPADDVKGKADQAAVIAKLRAAKAADFDRLFLQHEVAFHQATIDAINKTLLPAIQNAELRDLVNKVAPAFEGHRLAAATLEKKLAGAK